jgi:hypothetical protein
MRPARRFQFAQVVSPTSDTLISFSPHDVPSKSDFSAAVLIFVIFTDEGTIIQERKCEFS